MLHGQVRDSSTRLVGARNPVVKQEEQKVEEVHVEKLLDHLYGDLKDGMRGVSVLLAQARKIDPNITRKQVVKYLFANNTYTRHFRRPKKIEHNPWIASGPDSHHMADLAMLPSIKKFNKGYCYILVVVDVFSRYVFARALKNKQCATVSAAYEDILHTSRRIPSRLYTDKGTEFMGKTFRNLVKSLGIVHANPKNTNVKACYAENAIMRIKIKLEKWFTLSDGYSWINELQTVIDGLNATYMTSIGTSPERVTWKNAQKIWNRLYGTLKTRNASYKVGDTVRILIENTPLSKGTRAKWTREVFKVTKVVEYDIPVYILSDLSGSELDGIWYEEEMIPHTNVNISMEIDKIIRKRKKKGVFEYFVSFKDHNSSFNRWLSETDLHHFNGESLLVLR
ncbi:hypothetical protein CAEBREN_14542 [Caenorhabditis brenneri]|uniref:Integrase catalytic domain-containing protein n=1 Tax=Caenorhabditis brenneri TaxID=135651 RepID=G0PF14_CAEBE|nr:hypothetical protein CAEBREN_14542 [Caenorhabditis brenneri]